MLAIINITLPLFLLIGAGYATVRFHLMEKAQVAGMGRYILMVAFPIIIFHSIGEKDISEIVLPSYLLAYGLATIVMYMLSVLVARLLFKQDLLSSTLSAMGVSYSNSGFIGFPILTIVFDSYQVGALYLGMHVIIENLLTLPPTIAVAEAGGARARPIQVGIRLAKKLLKTPIIIALIISLICSAINLPIPKAIDKFLELISVSAPPIAIFVIGGSLYGVRLTSNIKEALLVSFSKLIIFPALVLGIMLMFPGLSDQSLAAGFLMAACPCATIYSLLSKQYGQGDNAANNILICTLLSFFTLTAALMIGKHFFGLHY